MNTAADPTVALSERAARQAEVVQALGRVLPAHALLWHNEAVSYTHLTLPTNREE